MAFFRLTCILGLLLPYSIALQVTPNSPCASICIDSNGDDISDPNASSTRNKDITCNDSEYTSSPAGQKFQRCISCLQDSTFSQGSENDQLWFLYNIRYAFDNCIFGFPDANGNPSTPCSTSTACGALEAALTGDDLKPNNLDYSYCDVDGSIMTSPMVEKCMSCVGATGDKAYLVNYLVALEAGCNQRPAAGTLVGLNDTVFSDSVIGPDDSSNASNKDDQPALPTTSIVGIAVGAVVVLLAIAGFFFVRHRKQRNRRLRLGGGPSLESRSRRRANHHRASSLSFRCQTHLTPRSPAFFPNQSETTIEEEKEHHINPHLALGSHPVTPESPASNKPSAAAWQKQQPLYSTVPSFSRPASGTLPLRNINITTTGPTVPNNVYHSTSPKASRFSPLEETPISTTSTKSTAQLLPLRPYNPAEYGVGGWHTGVEGSSSSSYITSPTSGSTTSPLLSRAWEQNQNQNQNQTGMSPIWERPQQQQQRESSASSSSRVVKVAGRIGGIPLSPGKKRRSTSETGSPTESKQFNMNFPAPPSPGARWGRS